MDIDAALVVRLIKNQFPEWAALPVTPVSPGGWDNRTFRLGDDMSVRMPSAARYASQVEKEHFWLPRLAPLLPLPIPQPLGRGQPAEGYPWTWSIYRWIGGDIATLGQISDLMGFANDLAAFLAALQRVPPLGGPAAGAHNFFRGGPIATYDQETRNAIRVLGRCVESSAATLIWDEALATRWLREPVWVHGDIGAGNLLVANGLLSAVIDFGSAGVGDPACDLAIAWTFFSGASRAAFRATLGVDRETWARGRAWALWKALITLVEHLGTGRQQEARAKAVIEAVLAEAAGPN